MTEGEKEISRNSLTPTKPTKGTLLTEGSFFISIYAILKSI
jgi:hypothetical protein